MLGAYYYLRVLVFMYMREPAPGAPKAVPMRSAYVVLAVVACAILVVVLGVLPGAPLDSGARGHPSRLGDAAAGFLRGSAAPLVHLTAAWPERTTMTHFSRFSAATSVVCLATAVGLVGACRSKPNAEPASAPSASSSSSSSLPRRPTVEHVTIDAGPMASGIPLPAASVERAINPGGVPPYAGPTGVVEGTIHVRGDRAPEVKVAAAAECADARAHYGKLFFESGDARALADALVAVTDYKGFVPAHGDVVPVSIRGCTYDQRTYSVTYGQHLEVTNLNRTVSFVPDLMGGSMPAQMVATPHGDPVKLYPLVPGYYEIQDQMNRPFLKASVYVLKYATHTVSGTDGRYRISGIPVGTVKVSALHPSAGTAKDQKVEVRADQTTTVDLDIDYKYVAPAPPSRSGEPNVR